MAHNFLRRVKAIKQTRNPPTLADVAREAGFSLTTASRVLNGGASVSKAKADKIQEVISRLDYRPNALARGLKARKTAAIGVIVSNPSDPCTAHAIKAVLETAHTRGYVVILASSGGYPEIERAEIKNLISRRVDGLLIAPVDGRNAHFMNIPFSGLPVVAFGQPIRNPLFDGVTIANRRGAREATRHLLDHGYRRIIALGVHPRLPACSERVAGYREALKRVSLEPRLCLAEHESMLASDWLSEAVFEKHNADAILCLNWVTTALLLRALRQLRKKPGRDVPILSCEDFELADMLTPGISAVRQPAERLGYEAARLLFERLNGEASKQQVSLVLPTELILRGSCGCSDLPNPSKYHR